jgi:hypothetical protein
LTKVGTMLPTWSLPGIYSLLGTKLSYCPLKTYGFLY